MSMSFRKEIVERELGLMLPEQYSAFLEKYGIYEDTGVEVYGMSDRLLGYHGLPCVIGATEKARQTDGLPHRFLVVEHTGVEDEMIRLDTENEKVYSISRVFGNRKIADSFDVWFERDIIEFHKRPNPYAGENIIMLDED
jgi:hypothetical protein